MTYRKCPKCDLKNFVIHSVGIKLKPINSVGKHRYTLQMPTRIERAVFGSFFMPITMRISLMIS